MKAAVITELGKPPIYGDFAEPEAHEGLVVVNVAASALNPLTKTRASGAHYSSSHSMPFVPGIDGVGRLENGQRVYFAFPKAPFGGLAERTLVGLEMTIPIPDHVDDITAAAIANPGMSSAAALIERAHIKPSETVLINGATGNAGRLAIRIAKFLGASKVIATGRDSEMLSKLGEIGADVTISLHESPELLLALLSKEFQMGVDIVLDYIYGASAEAILAAVPSGDPSRTVRFVQVGSVSAPSIVLRSSLLRSTDLTLMGSGIGSVPTAGLLKSIEVVLKAIEPAPLHIDAVTVPLSQVADVWDEQSSASRHVIVIK